MIAATHREIAMGFGNTRGISKLSIGAMAS